jgi:hypothetical protein
MWPEVEVMYQYGAFGIPLKTHQYEHEWLAIARKKLFRSV